MVIVICFLFNMFLELVLFLFIWGILIGSFEVCIKDVVVSMIINNISMMLMKGIIFMDFIFFIV